MTLFGHFHARTEIKECRITEIESPISSHLVPNLSVGGNFTAFSINNFLDFSFISFINFSFEPERPFLALLR
jgi:hypothetical protein